MAKDRDSAERAERKAEKRAAKKEREKRGSATLDATGETAGITKKSKKEKKHRRSTSADEESDARTAAAVLDAVADEKPKKVKVTENGDVAVTTTAKKAKRESAEDSGDEEGDRMDVEIKVKKEILPGALVPFAKPLADDKSLRKVLKGVKRATKKRALKRGVKEVVKSLRKTGEEAKNKPNSSLPFAVVVIAGDVSPIDVISHLPVLCEDYNVPYIFVPSRAELGAASSTKRPTSVVMVCRDVSNKGKNQTKDEEGEDSWDETYKDLVKLVMKADKDRKIY